VGAFADRAAPRSPSFNEADVSDKPPFIQQLPLRNAGEIAEIDDEYRTRLESLLALDEAIDKIIRALAEHGELENTYIFFTSDNGYFMGQQ
jgi:N-acetylglucosamine-6-sulfatase